MPHTVYKNQFKIDQIPKHKTKNYTPYRKKEKIFVTLVQATISYRSQKAQAIKKSISLREKM